MRFAESFYSVGVYGGLYGVQGLGFRIRVRKFTVGFW